MNTRYVFAYGNIKKWVIRLGIIVSLCYIFWWMQFSHISNPYLYIFLLLGEFYYLFMTYGYWFTVWGTRFVEKDNDVYFPTVDFFVPVCGEPLYIIEETIQAICAIRYKNGVVQDFPNRVSIYILNDGFIAGKDNWEEVETLSAIYPVQVVTRKHAGGAKAGNINHALPLSRHAYIAIFDADMKPYPEFLEKTCAYFKDRFVGFVQTPQYYENYKTNYVTRGAWSQQELFFGPICQGKNMYNAAFCCGTNVILRRRAIEEVMGFDTSNIAEDFSTSINIHDAGWKSIYYPQVLAGGLAPMTLANYYSQQLRWAKGSIDVFFHNNPLLKKHLSFAQKMQYLLSLSFYFMGVIVLIDALIPILYLFTGIVPVKGDSTVYILLFFPYIGIIIYILSESTAGYLKYTALQFSIGAFYIQIVALICSITNIHLKFNVTQKESDADRSHFLLVWPHICYILLGVYAITFALLHHGLNPAFVTNASWIVFNTVMFSGYVYAAFPALSKKHMHWFLMPRIFKREGRIDINIAK